MEEDLLEFKPSTEGKLTKRFVKIIAVRHAESLANTKGIYQGQTYDTDLSDLGRKQAKALAKRAKSLGVSKLISSPLRRTYQTVLEVASVCDCSIEISDLIIETNHGVWEGNSKDWIMSHYPEVYNAWLSSPAEVTFPGGESFQQTARRVEKFLASYRFEDDTLVVTHDNILRIMVAMANGSNLNEIWKHEIEPASLNFFEIGRFGGKNKLKVLKLNDNRHLEGLKADLTKHAF